MFQSAVCAVPWGWWLARNCLSDCYIPMELRNTSPIGHQGQVIKKHPLCKLCAPFGFSWAAAEYRGWDMLAGFNVLENVLTVHALAFRNASRQCLFCDHVPTLSWEWKNAMIAFTPSTSQGMEGVLQSPMISGFSKAVGYSHNCSPPPVLASWQEGSAPELTYLC